MSGGAVRKQPHAPALEVRHLRAFVALVDHGSVTGAAQAIGLAQSTVSASARAAVCRDDLAAYPLFLSDAADDFHTLLRDFFDAGGVPGLALEAAGSVEGVKQGVATDPRALGILPAYAVADELRAGRIAPVTLRPAPPRMALAALLSASRPRHPSVGALIDAVRTEAAPISSPSPSPRSAPSPPASP